jgi:hypothetical protein
MFVTKGWGSPEVFDMTSRARVLAEKTGDLPQLVQQLYAATSYAELRGEYRAAAELADQLLDIAQLEGSPASLGLANQTQLQARFFRGDFIGSEEHFAAGNAHF